MTSVCQKTIAVLITYHDERELLTDCLTSLRDQLPREIIVYDDSSEYRAEDYVPGDLLPHVRVIRGDTTHGPAVGRNALLHACTADYVHFHDADDWFERDWLASVSAAVSLSAADVVFTEVRSRIDAAVLNDRVLGLARLKESPDLVKFCIRGAMLTPAGTYDRRCVTAIGGYRESLWQAEDFDFHVRLAASGVSYAVIDRPLVCIRIREAGRSQRRAEVYSCGVQAIRLLSEELGTEYRGDLAEAASAAASALWMAGANREADAALALAFRLGRPTFRNRGPFYGVLAKCIGVNASERAAAAYRRCIPRVVRGYIRHHAS